MRTITVYTQTRRAVGVVLVPEGNKYKIVLSHGTYGYNKFYEYDIIK